MGFFSWNCKGCNKSVRSRHTNAGHKDWMNKSVVVTEKGSVIKGEYDGYGRIGDGDFDLNECGSFTLWHEACWDSCGRPMIFNGQSDSANDQGYFCGEVLTLFPPGHDKNEVKQRHIEEISRILAEIRAALPGVDLVDEWPLKRVAEVAKALHDKDMENLRRELRGG